MGFVDPVTDTRDGPSLCEELTLRLYGCSKLSVYNVHEIDESTNIETEIL